MTPAHQQNFTMPRSASPKRMVYSWKKIMLTMILVLFGLCFWPAQMLTCHGCNSSNSCTIQQVCEEEERVCISEILRMPNYTRIRKLCFTSCEDYFQGETLEKEQANATGESIISKIVSEVSQMTNKNTYLFRKTNFMENAIVCCEFDLCNQARARGPGDIALVFGLLLSFMWLIRCSML